MIATLLFGLGDPERISRSSLDAAALILKDARVYAEAALATLLRCQEKGEDVRRSEELLAKIDRAFIRVKAHTPSERRGLWGLADIVHRIVRKVHQRRS
jgi:hypothetical protein